MKVREVNLSGHMPELDGIRGLAILAVLVFHATIFRPTAAIDEYYFRFGSSLWVGVDLFFVLSGFLITGILFDAKGSAHFFRNFYARRALRIFPLYYLVLAITIFLLPKWFSRFPRVGGEQWYYWTYLSNFDLVERGLDHLILGPTWSLAIEEQFYIVWPAIVFLFSRKSLMATCSLLILAATLFRWWLLENGAHANVMYLSTYTRMDALAVGALLALWARGPHGIRALFPWIWLAFLTFGILVFYFVAEGQINKKLPEMVRYGYLAVALFFGSALVVTLTRPVTSWVYRILTHKLLLFFGKYSYAIYLFNRPFVDIFEDNWFKPNQIPTLLGSSIPGQLLFTLVLIAIPTALAVISWHTFEKHFLFLKRYFVLDKRDRLS